MGMKRRVTLRKVTVRDAHLLTRWLNDKHIVGSMNPILRCDHHTVQELQRDIKTCNPHEELWFMVHIPGKKEPIGHGGIDDIDFHDKRGEIFFFIGDKKEWGKGYGTETAHALVDYAFKKLRLHSLFASAMVTNISSQRVLQKIGFRKIGIRRGYNCIGKKFVDEILYDLTADEHKQRRKVYK